MKIKLDLADTSFMATKKVKKEKYCNECFMWKHEEQFSPDEDRCKDCLDA